MHVQAEAANQESARESVHISHSTPLPATCSVPQYCVTVVDEAFSQQADGLTAYGGLTNKMGTKP